MRHPVIVILLLAVLLTGACTGSGQGTPNQPVASPTAAPMASPTTAAAQVCSTVALVPTPDASVPSLFPVTLDTDRAKGPEDAAMTIVEYADFQCPACSSLAPILTRLNEKYGEEVRVVFRHFPLLSLHDKAALASQAAEAANEQGKFWEMHDRLYETLDTWNELTVEEFETWLGEQANELGLDVAQFNSDLKREDIVAQVQKGWDDGTTIGLPGTPFLLINGQIYGGPIDFNSLDQIASLLVLGKRQFTSCPTMEIDPSKEYIATLQTDKGEIVLQLYPDKAPLAVNSFVFLARNGWFDQITFHRVIPGFVAQTGDPSGTGVGGPGYIFNNESDPTLRFDRPGVVGMANSGPNTNGSQFFITYAPAPHLDGKYTIFGQLISGFEVLEQLTARDPQPGVILPDGDFLFGISIEER